MKKMFTWLILGCVLCFANGLLAQEQDAGKAGEKPGVEQVGVKTAETMPQEAQKAVKQLEEEEESSETEKNESANRSAPTEPAQHAYTANDSYEKTVYVIPIKGVIDPKMVFVVRRSLKEAELNNVAAIIFEMDTPGGVVDSASKIVKLTSNLKIPTYTFVERHALSAGAYVSLGTDHIYMAPGSVIGDCIPILTLFADKEEPDYIREKIESPVAAMLRSTAQAHGHDPDLAEAMVRRSFEYKVGDEVISPAGQILTLSNTEAERKIREGGKPLLSEGTVMDVHELLEHINLPDAQIKEFKATQREQIALFIHNYLFLFLIGALIGIFIEIKTPGFGIPGTLGIVCIIVFFWGMNVAGLAGSFEIMLFVIGLILLAVEVFITPGFGFLGISGILLILTSLVAAMVESAPGGPWMPEFQSFEFPFRTILFSLVGASALMMLLNRYLPKAPFMRGLVLEKSTDKKSGFVSSKTESDLVGKTGEAIMALRPSGIIMCENRKLDVVTRGEFFEKGTWVRIAEVHGFRIVVEKLEEG